MSSDSRRLWMNRWQLEAILYFSNINRWICGRGTGKTTGMAYVIKEVVRTMPRSSNALVARTYLQAFTRTLPAIVAGLSQHGLYEGSHFVIGKEPPKKWDKPFFPPLKSYENFISFYNGTGYHIVSQDRKGSSRGFNIDSWLADEGLNLIQERIETEIIVANRANANGPFANSPYHLSELIVSSMPFLPESMWLLDLSKYYDLYGKNYLDYRQQLSGILLQIVDSDSEELIRKLWDQAYQLKLQWRFFQHVETLPISNEKLTKYFCDADVFDNIENLPGWRYIKQIRASMSDLMFSIEILNTPMMMLGEGFYPALSEKHLLQIDTDQYHLTVGQKVTAEDEPAINPSMEIHASADYGGSFNCIILSQEYDDEERLVNALKVYHPQLFRDVVQLAIEFLSTHKTRTIHFWYDQTAIAKDGLVEYNYADEFFTLFTKAGWKVIMHYNGAAPSHHSKFMFMNELLGEKNVNLPSMRMHPENCRDAYTSMRLAPIRTGKNGFEKDKSAERNKKIDQVTAPHLSDAVDVLMFHKYSHRLTSQGGGFSAGL
jgi:hypothetical protein